MRNRLFPSHGCGAVGNCLGYEGMTIGCTALQGDKQISRFHRAAIKRNASDQGIAVPHERAADGDLLQESPQRCRSGIHVSSHPVKGSDITGTTLDHGSPGSKCYVTTLMLKRW